MKQEAEALCASLQRWLIRDAYPLWWERGADRTHGGFHESLRLDGSATGAPRRARLHPRQINAFADTRSRRWSGPRQDAVRHALDFFLTHYPLPNRMIRALVAEDGRPLDEHARLYDQAFALLGFASAYSVLADDSLRRCALALLDELRASLASDAGFEESLLSQTDGLPRLANSHMHLLEAALAWMALDTDDRWQTLASEIVELALAKFVDTDHGFIREYFDAHWRALPGIAGRVVEPGHQFEWAWLLLRWYERTRDERIDGAALHLIDLAERHGVDRDREVAVNSLLADGSVHDPVARLWPQTERMRAACLAATVTRDAHYWTIAAKAARSLSRYLDTPLAGMWRDQMLTDGSFVVEATPASSFYHIVGAIDALDQALQVDN